MGFYLHISGLFALVPRFTLLFGFKILQFAFDLLNVLDFTLALRFTLQSINWKETLRLLETKKSNSTC